MKKLIALVAVATMLFGLVGTASAYDVNMEIFVNPDLMQRGADDYGTGGDLNYSFTPGLTTNYQFANTVNMTISGKYADAIKWYNYGNSASQEAWLRIPIIFDSVDSGDFLNVNTKSTQWSGQTGKLIQSGSYVTINGVMYPVGVIQGRNVGASSGTVNYNPFYRDANSNTDGILDASIKTSANADTTSNALGIIYSLKLQSGGCSETLNISYSPNGVEVYKATINVVYLDTATANNATIARETGSNAAYFNAKFTGGDTMAFDNVLKSGNMISTNVNYSYRGTDGDLFDDSDVSTDKAKYDNFYLSGTNTANKAYLTFPTIVMEAKVKLLDQNGNSLPVRTQLVGKVDGETDADAVGAGYKDTMTAFITNKQGATGDTRATGKNHLFTAKDAYDSTFDSATRTDDDSYAELDASGEYTVRVRVIDNSTSLYNELMRQFIEYAFANDYTIKPYFSVLENVSVVNGSDTYNIEGVKNRVNYLYLEDVEQNVYTYSMYDRQFLSYDLKLNALDRIEAASFAITGNSSEMLPVGSTRQLQATTGHASAIITDRQVNWKSSNPAVATVNATTGLVTAVADGTTYITAQYAVGTGYDTVAVTVGTPVVATPEITAPTTTQYFVAVGSSSSLNVRSGANTKSARVGRLKRGDTVNVYEIVDGWAKIDYNGSIAYVSSRYISQ